MVVVPRVDGIEVYLNQEDQIVILQIDASGHEDALVCFSPIYADAICAAIQKAKGDL